MAEQSDLVKDIIGKPARTKHNDQESKPARFLNRATSASVRCTGQDLTKKVQERAANETFEKQHTA